MKKLLLAALLLATSVGADPAPFGAKFDKPYKKERDKDGTAYSYEHGNPAQSQLVIVLNKQMTLPALKAFTLKTMPPNLGHYEEKTTRVSNHPAIQLEGINEQGVPYSVLLVNVKGQSVLAGSATYDMARNREFIHSLKL
ncbi:MAG: hypothetical protein KF760_31980 [Candidatus Eremiobacteraeota bacterium]|nr:hypothetical protein [Candidatus Eremiobacteraeota bacterium]MCW5871474.1 hypothetical protein [Candidatus Eremiobacteraeota bacterium]